MRVRASQQIGVLRALHEAVGQLGRALAPFVPSILAAFASLLVHATHVACAAPGADAAQGALLPAAARLTAADGSLLGAAAAASLPEGERLTLAQAREARLWCMKLLAALLRALPTYDFRRWMPIVFGCAAPVLGRLATHYTQSANGLLTTLLTMVEEPATLPLLALAPAPVLPPVYATIAARRLAPAVLDTLLAIVEALLRHARASAPAAAPTATAPTLRLTAATATATTAWRRRRARCSRRTWQICCLRFTRG